MSLSSATTTVLRRIEPATPDAVAPVRHAVAAFARRHGLSETRTADVALVVSEAFSNATLHAYAGLGRRGTVELEARLDDGALRILVRDRGHGPVPRPDSPGLGLGLPLMYALADRCVVEDAGPGTSVELRFDLHQDP